MPSYDFKCEPCESTFEITRSVSDRSDVCCPECGAVAKRVFTPVGVVFKGSGFHNTDYRPKKSDGGKEADAEKPAACPSANSGCKGCPASSD